MMKPDWKDAPEWAEWLAMDECGEWYWYELEPVKQACTWMVRLVNSKCEFSDINKKWSESLERRP